MTWHPCHDHRPSSHLSPPQSPAFVVADLRAALRFGPVAPFLDGLSAPLSSFLRAALVRDPARGEAGADLGVVDRIMSRPNQTSVPESCAAASLTSSVHAPLHDLPRKPPRAGVDRAS